ncbi:hypothetical protein ACF1AE_24255 [Streptomyces sp. NPDC014986]|uniref:hypothetical protein n=1 Tax=Streptomyces sp. NPDC014986 TaxID=3364934 RepID=UPI0036F9F618
MRYFTVPRDGPAADAGTDAGGARRGGGGWETRVGVHRLFPLPVHAVPFGRDYAEQALAVARPAAAG